MQKIILMRGLPGSGKSTRAKEIQSKNPGSVIVSKDIIRKEIGGNFSLRKEDDVNRREVNQAIDALRKKRNVIVDDTNMKYIDYSIWENIARNNNATIEIEELKTPWKECIMRDLSRFGTDKYIGEQVIINMGMKFGKIPENEMVICDIDGTIADCSHRMKYIDGKVKDWDKFFSEVGKDSTINDVIRIIRKYNSEGKRIILVTGRNEDCRKQTTEWLHKNNIPFFALLMRTSGDRKEDYVVKCNILESYFKDHNKIIKIIDDRPQVICKIWLPNFDAEKIIDVGNDESFVEERKAFDYWSDKDGKNKYKDKLNKEKKGRAFMYYSLSDDSLPAIFNTPTNIQVNYE